jgi:hypothetical protein
VGRGGGGTDGVRGGVRGEGWAKAAAAVAGEEGKEEGDEGKAAGKEGGDGIDWVAKAAESRRAWAERRARGDIDPTLEKIASEY